MKARIAIQIGVRPAEWRLLKKAAQAQRLPLATYVREVAVKAAETDSIPTANAAGHFTDRPA